MVNDLYELRSSLCKCKLSVLQSNLALGPLVEQVLGLLGVDQSNDPAVNSENPLKAKSAIVAELPDLIHTGDSNDCYVMDNTTKSSNDKNVENSTPTTPLVDDIFGDFSGSVTAGSELKNEEDPFADVSFHTGESKEQADDLFSGMTVGDKKIDKVTHMLGNRSKPETFDIFASNSDQGNHKEVVSDLMAGLSIEGNTSSIKQKLTSPAPDLNNHVGHQRPDNTLGDMLGSQAIGFNVNPMFPTGHLPYSVHPGVMMNQLCSSQPLNYGAMGNLLAQQQFLATMANFQQIDNANLQNASMAQIGGAKGTAPLPDIFQSNFASQNPNSIVNSSKKEETKAFDFISVSMGIFIIPFVGFNIRIVMVCYELLFSGIRNL